LFGLGLIHNKNVDEKYWATENGMNWAKVSSNNIVSKKPNILHGGFDFVK